jgi:two-component sensor histidine kinase
MMEAGMRVYLLLSAIALVGLGGFFSLYLMRWESRKNVFTMVLILLAMLWIFSYLMESVERALAAKVFWFNVQYLALICIPPFCLASTIRITRISKRQAWANISITFSFSLGLVLALASNGLHGQFFRSYALNNDGLSVRKSAGPIYYLYIVYIFTVFFVSAAILIANAVSGARSQRRRPLVTLLAIGVPVLVGIVDLIWPELWGSLEVAPLSALVSSAILLVGAVRYRFLDPVPLARADLVEKLADPVFVFEPEGGLLYANARARDLAPVDAPVILSAAQDGDEVSLDGRDWAVASEAVPVPGRPGRAGEVAARIVSLRDVTTAREAAQRLEDIVRERTEGLAAANRSLEREIERTRRSEAALTASLKEKELLLRELNHRVKNNLQVVSSLIRLQSSRMPEGEARQALDSAQGRIRSISLVHERMYRAGLEGRVVAEDYLRDIANGVAAQRQGARREVSVKVDGGGIELDLDSAVNLGLIVNESVDNAFKHVFERGRGSRLEISLTRGEGDIVRLRVSDDGPGFEPRCQAGGLGLRMIEAIARQMDGRIVVGDPGAGVLEVEIRTGRRQRPDQGGSDGAQDGTGG